MLYSHYRVMERRDFVETLGAVPVTPERCAHSTAVRAATYFFDAEGRAMAYVGYQLGVTGDFVPTQHAMAAAPPESLQERATLWL